MSATLAAALEAELKKHATLRWREANKDAVANHN
ncbi:type II toxin-antitoxin system CcdA family antitoxin [Klebsiella aerogenes]|nr:type II toxin-antitoxin system CcdA family antitoxin [Klebsiella aerogenes]UNX73859.1 type II toxin-antitoxin system CcdA family antitoxin [Klebsiella aerogenes]